MFPFFLKFLSKFYIIFGANDNGSWENCQRALKPFASDLGISDQWTRNQSRVILSHWRVILEPHTSALGTISEWYPLTTTSDWSGITLRDPGTSAPKRWLLSYGVYEMFYSFNSITRERSWNHSREWSYIPRITRKYVILEIAIVYFIFATLSPCAPTWCTLSGACNCLNWIELTLGPLNIPVNISSWSERIWKINANKFISSFINYSLFSFFLVKYQIIIATI